MSLFLLYLQIIRIFVHVCVSLKEYIDPNSFFLCTPSCPDFPGKTKVSCMPKEEKEEKRKKIIHLNFHQLLSSAGSTYANFPDKNNSYVS